MADLENLKITAGFAAEDERYLRLAGEVLADQTRQIVTHWRSGIIAGIPNLARHSRTPEGEAIPAYLERSQPPLPAMDSGHMPATVRPGVDQLSARDRSTTY